MDVKVVVGRTGAGVNVDEEITAGVSVGETDRGMQATNKTRRNQKPERFIKFSILSLPFGVL